VVYDLSNQRKITWIPQIGFPASQNGEKNAHSNRRRPSRAVYRILVKRSLRWRRL
jgi:hypothetical protein